MRQFLLSVDIRKVRNKVEVRFRRGLIAGVFVQVWVVGFQVNPSTFRKHPSIVDPEAWCSKATVLAAMKRIRKSDPDFRNLSDAKEVIDGFDAGAQEGGVGHACFFEFGGPQIDPCPFDVNADEVAIGMSSSESNSVFTTTTGEFQRDWIAVAEVIFGPTSAHVFFLPRATDYVVASIRSVDRCFVVVGVGLKLRKAPEFVATGHGAKIVESALPTVLWMWDLGPRLSQLWDGKQGHSEASPSS